MALRNWLNKRVKGTNRIILHLPVGMVYTKITNLVVGDVISWEKRPDDLFLVTSGPYLKHSNHWVVDVQEYASF